LEIRISGALLLLYGITVTRIARLSATDIARSRTSTFLTIDRRPGPFPIL